MMVLFPPQAVFVYTTSCHYGKTLGIPADIHILSSQSLFQAHGFNLADFASPAVKEHTCGDPIKKLWGKMIGKLGKEVPMRCHM